MRPGLSTFVFLPERLDTSLLEALRRAGAETIEIVAARHHFDYTDRPTLRDLGRWFGDTGTLASLDQPRFADTHWSRHVSHSLHLLDPDKGRRIAAMDETKRALEAAEHIPFRSLTLYLGQPNDPWDDRTLDLSLTTIEHLKAFAAPLGVQLLLENIDNDITTPAHLLEILRTGHFNTVGITLDLGHAHLESSRHRTAEAIAATHQTDHTSSSRDTRRQTTTADTGSAASVTTAAVPSSAASIDHALTLLTPRLVQLHLHDNDGTRDTHLAPGILDSGGINWSHLTPRLAQLPEAVLAILELANDPAATPETITTRARTSLDYLRQLTDQAQANPAASR